MRNEDVGDNVKEGRGVAYFRASGVTDLRNNCNIRYELIPLMPNGKDSPGVIDCVAWIDTTRRPFGYAY